MNQAQNVKDILSAIASVRLRATEALAAGSLTEYSSLMLDLLALERCLVYQTQAMMAA